MATLINDRIDVRISREQKELVKYASELRGFKSLSEFIVFCINKESSIIIKDNNIVEVSDITIAEIAVPSNQNSPFVKSGYEIIPRLSNFYGKEQNMMPYYAEIYLKNEFSDTLIGVKQTIISTETNQEVMVFVSAHLLKLS